jgi:hypothetical protein
MDRSTGWGSLFMICWTQRRSSACATRGFCNRKIRGKPRGYVHNVVFTCGAVAESDGTVKIYWGGADTVMCAGEAKISDLVALCLNHARPAK